MSKTISKHQASTTAKKKVFQSKIDDSSSSDEDDECDESNPLIDPELVQITAPKEEIDRRMEAFIKRKREEINESNVLEFCQRLPNETEDFSCARTDSILTTRQQGSSSHLRKSQVSYESLNFLDISQYHVCSQVINEWGPQTIANRVDHGSLLKNAKRIKREANFGSPSKSQDGVSERISDLEKKTCLLDSNKPVPKDVYQRLKALEDRIGYLESISPEYFDRKPRSNSTENASEKESLVASLTNMQKKEERKEEIAKSLSGINTRIQELQASLRVVPKTEPKN